MTSVKEVDDKLIRRLPAEIGTYLININLDKALTFLDEAMLILPNERYCVFNRAIARKKSMNIRAALDDVSAALKLDPQDLRVHAINNEIIFLRKNFEKALILNDRFSKLRSQPDDFKMGHLKCMNAVVNAIHQEYCGHPLRDHFKVIRQQAWQKAAKSRVKTFKCKEAKKRSISFRSNTELLKHLQESSKTKNDSEKRVRSDGSGTQVISTISSSQDASEESIIHMELRDDTERKMKIPKLVDYPFRPLQERTSNIENYISERYLEKLHWEKLFLKKLTSRKGFDVPNKRHEEKIKHVVDKCHKHLCNLQELLRSCKPFYHIKYQEKRTQLDLWNTRNL
ncbi:hypothetical protein WA026_009729 [Henosepilachna vigintioctopunctata]|uniref:Uncharacterized protein n=1 Tax=Henosepilachna vigintioctopunctata TaxID=420089 RepID=A0AAW1TQT7_9CUCU